MTIQVCYHLNIESGCDMVVMLCLVCDSVIMPFSWEKKLLEFNYLILNSYSGILSVYILFSVKLKAYLYYKGLELYFMMLM